MSLGDLPVGALVTIVVTGTLDPSSLGDVSNTATVSSSTDDPNPADNTIEATARAAAIADLSITKTGVLTEFVPGQTASWTIEVTNGGPSDATDVIVTDTLPSAGLSGVTSTPSQGSCATPSTCQLGTVAAGSTATITVSGTLSSGYTAADITNAASVTSATFDPAPGDETASSTVPVVPIADLSIVKLAVDEPFVPGAPVRWSLTVTNNGPSAATSVTVDDTLPIGATISTADTDGRIVQRCRYPRPGLLVGLDRSRRDGHDRPDRRPGRLGDARNARQHRHRRLRHRRSRPDQRLVERRRHRRRVGRPGALEEPHLTGHGR